MSDIKQIKTALISVYHKDGLDEILSLLHKDGVEFLSTGGTKSFIESLGYNCQAVEDLTGYPSILGGRVKTLHPKIFGGILNRRENATDCQQVKQYAIPSIDVQECKNNVAMHKILNVRYVLILFTFIVYFNF